MKSPINSRACLIILDGWGINKDPKVSAIEAANTPYFDTLCKKYANATLVTHGSDVGLPDGQMGNSEVGHLNIGAGRVVFQELARINNAISNGYFAEDRILKAFLEKASEGNARVHLMGLVSDGGVHSHIDHLKALCDVVKKYPKLNAFIHAFTDGRDVDPKSGAGFIRELNEYIDGTNSSLASIVGRYYAMDRDKRWERTKKAYDLIVEGNGKAARDPVSAVEASYAAGVTDEFIEPIVMIGEQGKPVAVLKDGDFVIFFNFRTDRPRQLVTVLTQQDMPDNGMHTLDIDMLTMTAYDDSYSGLTVLFEKEDLQETFGEVVSKLGKTQVRIAETEKYPHVTFFFSGGRESEFDGESRILVPSPKVATYDLQPEMSALIVTEKLIAKVRTEKPDFICLNYANADMVGHTGVFEAAVKAVETVDGCLSELVPVLLEHDYGIIIIADHGNSDVLVNPDGSPNTAHTKKPVPVIFVSEKGDRYTIQDGILADIAPTLLQILGVEQPAAMTGSGLLGLKE